MSEEIKLTKFSHGAGCGCKIAPGVLEKILKGSPDNQDSLASSRLLVGYDTKDDAAAYDLGNGKAVISTTDFFMPIVDDPFDFGRVASVNAISDVYAMGGHPLMAIAILGWPIEKIPAEVAGKVLDGARSVCREADIPLAGGHSIDSPEPIFGLAVTGEADIVHLKKNSTATEGCELFLTKPLGVGMITTAQKRGLALPEDFREALKWMTRLNRIGEEFGRMSYVKAMTDVTGFGLLGHLIEMCEGSGLSAEIDYSKIPLIPNIGHYVSKMIYPDGTMRNWKSYEAEVDGIGAESLFTLADPQTSGGLLAAVEQAHSKEFRDHCLKKGMELESIGRLTGKKEKTVFVR